MSKKGYQRSPYRKVARIEAIIHESVLRFDRIFNILNFSSAQILHQAWANGIRGYTNKVRKAKTEIDWGFILYSCDFKRQV